MRLRANLARGPLRTGGNAPGNSAQLPSFHTGADSGAMASRGNPGENSPQNNGVNRPRNNTNNPGREGNTIPDCRLD